MEKEGRYFEDEIDLYELWLVIWRGKKIIIAFVMAFTLLAFIYANTRQVLYDVKAVVVPNNIYAVGLNFNPAGLIYLVKNDYYIQKVFGKQKVKINARFLRSLNAVEISYKTNKVEKAAKRLRRFIELITSDTVFLSSVRKKLELKLSEYNLSLAGVDKGMGIVKKQISTIEQRIKETESAIRNIEIKIKKLKGSLRDVNSSDVRALFYVNIYQVAVTRLNNLQNLDFELKDKLAGYMERLTLMRVNRNKIERDIKFVSNRLENLKPFVIADGPRTVEVPRKTTIIVAVAFVVSLFIGIFVVLFLNWIDTVRRRPSKDNS